MGVIHIRDGIQTFSFNGKCDVAYNPTDVFFLEQVYNVFDDLDKQQEQLDKQKGELKTPAEVFAFARERDTKMRERVNGLFGGVDVCTALFGNINIYAMDGDGLPLWAGILLAVTDTMADGAEKEQRKMSPRVEKYLKKYHR